MSQKLQHHISEPALIENPFWAFSLQVYGRDRVKNACLDLQNRFGADVNILLFLCWRNSIGLPNPTMSQIKEMVATIADINRDVITPLRRVRTALPGMDAPGAPEARKKVLEAELSAEQMAQAALYRAFPRPSSRLEKQSETVLPALLLYFRILETEEAALLEVRPVLSDLVEGIIPSDTA